MAGPLVDLGGFFTVTTMTCSATVSAIIGNMESYRAPYKLEYSFYS